MEVREGATRQGRNAMRNQPIPLEKPVSMSIFGQIILTTQTLELNICCSKMYV
jgi:hypothetical protein